MFNKKYYTLDKILSKNCVYNLIIGERSNGKTYSALKYALDRYFKYGEKFAIIRRWNEDIKGRRASDIFNALIDNNEISKMSNKEYDTIQYYAGKFYRAKIADDTIVCNKDFDNCGYIFSLSDNEHNKSISYPNVQTIIFDEFITNRIYLIDEFVIFMNTLSTIIRQRKDVKIFMLGNTINKYCPYFEEFGLSNIRKQKQGTIDVYTYGDTRLTLAVEYCDTIKNKTKDNNNFYYAFNNPKLNMITTGAWQLDIYPHLPVKYKPSDILFIYYIEFDYELFQCEIIEIDNSQIFTYIHIKTTPIKDYENSLIYGLDNNGYINYNKNIFKPINRLQERVMKFFKIEKVFYQNNSVGDTINNYLKICKRSL